MSQPPGSYDPPQHGQDVPAPREPLWVSPPPAPQWAPPPPTGPGQWEELGSTGATGYPPAPVAHRRRGPLAAALAVVAVVAGSVVTYVAVSDSSSQPGAASPTAAIQSIVDDINKSDLVGVLDDLVPAERTAVAAPLLKDIDELKRVNVLQNSADAKHVAAVQASIKNLTFAPTLTVNDHVQIVRLTGGTVRLAADVSKIPFTAQFVKTLFPTGAPTSTSSDTLDIGQADQSNGGQPVRIAAQKVGGRWYPSLFYTIADNAAAQSGSPMPTAADYVAAHGATDPGQAVQQLVNALLGGNIAAAIATISPDELGALHDYAGVIMKNTGPTYASTHMHLDQLQVKASPLPDGQASVTLTGLTLTNSKGQQLKVSIDVDCIIVEVSGQSQTRTCPSQLGADLSSAFEGFNGTPLSGPQTTALTDVLGQGAATGIIVSTSGGEWYVNPVQTLLGATTELLQRLKGNDLYELIGLFKSFGN